jgi:hypothetical protein
MGAVASHYVTFQDLTSQNRGFDLLSDALPFSYSCQPYWNGLISMIVTPKPLRFCFLMGLAMFFGASRGAWIIACIIQGVVFGAAHSYQNPLGMLITGTFGILLGILVIISGRNLWVAIIAHGLFDAGRSILFYFLGPPG